MVFWLGTTMLLVVRIITSSLTRGLLVTLPHRETWRSSDSGMRCCPSRARRRQMEGFCCMMREKYGIARSLTHGR